MDNVEIPRTGASVYAPSRTPRGGSTTPPITFQVKFVPAGTGPAVWDDPWADRVVERFMPVQRASVPTIGILHLGDLRPTPSVLRQLIVPIGEDIRDGRYGLFSFVVSSSDGATRQVIGDIAAANSLPVFITSSPAHLEEAVPAGVLTANERGTLDTVFRAGGTVTVAEIAKVNDLEQTTAGNRLVNLQRKGYLQRIERPHPEGDQFVDPRTGPSTVAGTTIASRPA